MRKELLVGAWLTIAAVPAGAATVVPGVLDFEGDICVQPNSAEIGPCFDYDPIGQDYGDIDGRLDVSYGDATFWGIDYEPLTNVVFGVSQTVLSITFTASPGYGVSITGFDLANFLNVVASTMVRVVDPGSGAVLWDSGTFVPESGCGPKGDRDASDRFCFFSVLDEEGSGISGSSLRLDLGPDSFWVGLDNIAFTTFEMEQPAPIPLPASVWLLGAAVAGLAGLRRRRG